MAQLIDKDVLVAEIERIIKSILEMVRPNNYDIAALQLYKGLLSFIDTLEVQDPYEHLVQYPSREDGIKAHAEDYSWNIESELFQQLTPEQQKLWRKEIEQACISGGYSGLNLAKDPRYKENLEVKEVDLDLDYITEELDRLIRIQKPDGDFGWGTLYNVATHFFELGLKAQKGEEV